jgi:hypothetical protein
MKLSELKQKIDEAIDKHGGDIDCYGEGIENTQCSECGEPRDMTHSGVIKGVYNINTNGKMALWLTYECE